MSDTYRHDTATTRNARAYRAARRAIIEAQVIECEARDSARRIDGANALRARAETAVNSTHVR